MEGMNHLWRNSEETGTIAMIGLRFLQTLAADGRPIKETCGAGFHRNWFVDLEPQVPHLSLANSDTVQILKSGHRDTQVI